MQSSQGSNLGLHQHLTYIKKQTNKCDHVALCFGQEASLKITAHILPNGSLAPACSLRVPMKLELMGALRSYLNSS